MIENIRNIDTINIDDETKVKLRDHFRKIYKDEKKTREIMERQIRGSTDKDRSSK
jgi:hypothetical protein